jgi:hypothetical protein
MFCDSLYFLPYANLPDVIVTSNVLCGGVVVSFYGTCKDNADPDATPGRRQLPASPRLYSMQAG